MNTPYLNITRPAIHIRASQSHHHWRSVELELRRTLVRIERMHEDWFSWADIGGAPAASGVFPILNCI